MRIVGISDVSLGYGSPQVPLLVSSLAEYYGAEGVLLEPSQPGYTPRHLLFPDLRILRIDTVLPPHSEKGRNEYLWRAVKTMNDLRPDILMVTCTYCLPVVFTLKRRPNCVIYYSLESIPAYGEFDVEMNRQAKDLIDLIIFPEENRAARDISRCGFESIPTAILYNCANARSSVKEYRPATDRNGRILYSGTIDRERTLAEYFFHEQMQAVGMDLFGNIRADSGLVDEIANLKGAVRYCGFVDAKELAALRKAYHYSIVMWAPTNENQIFAAPNKFFESIADGVPPIVAPHPQCKILTERYQCGILMPDWSFEGFYAAVQRAREVRLSARYQTLVENCATAVEAELNWETQFAKLTPHLGGR